MSANDNILFNRIQELQKQLKKIQNEREEHVEIERNGPLWWSIIILSVFFISIIVGQSAFILFHLKEGHKATVASHKAIKEDIQELKSEYEATSCINCRASKHKNHSVSATRRDQAIQSTIQSTSFIGPDIELKPIDPLSSRCK